MEASKQFLPVALFLVCALLLSLGCASESEPAAPQEPELSPTPVELDPWATITAIRAAMPANAPTPPPAPTPALAPVATPTPAPTAKPALPTVTVTPTPEPYADPTPTPRRPRGISDGEWEALVAFYHSTGGPNWKNNQNWLSDQPITQWYGFSKGFSQLVLPDNGLTGELPPELGKLTRLDWLDLSGNQLTGELPPELGNLTELLRLYLNDNQLTGEMPLELGNLRRLGRGGMNLSGNQFTDTAISLLPLVGNKDVSQQILEEITGQPWFQDGLSRDEHVLIRYLYGANLHSPPLDQFLEIWNLITGQAWYQDGLTSAELALIGAGLHAVQWLPEKEGGETSFTEMIKRGRLMTKAITTPMGTDVELVLVTAEASVGVQDLEYLHTAIEVTEDFMGVPWPTARVEMRAGGIQGGGLASRIYWHTFDELAEEGPLVVARNPPNFEEAPGGYKKLGRFSFQVHDSGQILRGHLAHELSHIYWCCDGSRYLNEGAADFFESYTPAKIDNRNVEYPTYWGRDIKISCHSFSNFYEFLDASMRGLPGRGCDYSLGSQFWMAIYFSLGHEVAQSQMREMYLATLDEHFNNPLFPHFAIPDDDPQSVARRDRVHGNFYKILLSATPPEKRDEFRELYRRIHGGPMPEP